MSLKAKIFYGFLTSVALVVVLAAFGVLSISDLASRFEDSKEQVVSSVVRDARAIEKSSAIASLGRDIDRPQTLKALEAEGFESRITKTISNSAGIGENLDEIGLKLNALLESRANYLRLRESLPSEIDALKVRVGELNSGSESYFEGFEEVASRKAVRELEALVREREQSKIAAKGVEEELSRFPDFKDADYLIADLWTAVASIDDGLEGAALVDSLAEARAKIESAKNEIEASSSGLHRKLKKSFTALLEALVPRESEESVNYSISLPGVENSENPSESVKVYSYDGDAAIAALRKISRASTKYGSSQRADAVEMAGLSLSSLFVRASGGGSDSDAEVGLGQRLIEIKQAYADLEISLSSVVSECDYALAYIDEEGTLDRYNRKIDLEFRSIQNSLAVIREAAVSFENGDAFSSHISELSEGIFASILGGEGLSKEFANLASYGFSMENARGDIVNTLSRIQESTLERSENLVDNLSTSLDEIIVNAASTKQTLIIVCVVTVVVSLLLGVFLPSFISKQLVAMSSQIGSVTSELSVAAEQVLSTSGSLAAGASQQASSLEETNAALQEISARSIENASSAEKTAKVTQLSREAAEGGVAEMKELEQAMKGIEESSREVAQIIKTIEEIAFQTNILALNAAVEAARAGEEGAGFAVVAEEVRNLAGRVSSAAHETNDKIETAIGSSKQGVNISLKAKSRLENILSSILDADTYVSGISESTTSQSEGINQISESMSHMDEVTQTAAASAQQTADAAKALDVQSTRLQSTVLELNLILHGKSGDRIERSNHRTSVAAKEEIVDDAWGIPQRSTSAKEDESVLWN